MTPGRLATPTDAGPIARPEPAPRLPPSLVGTEVDGALVVDADGRFVPTPDAIDLFDYYLSAHGEEPAAATEARIRAAIAARLDGAAARDATRLLEQYLDYRREAAALVAGPAIGEDLERRIQFLRELRREIFGESIATALFADEEARWFADLERRRILTDESLPAEEVARALAAVDAGEAPGRVAERERTRAHVALRNEEATLRSEGAMPEEIQRLRETRFGPEAANRLAALDERRGEWDRRLLAYRTELGERVANAPTQDHAAIRDALRATHFPDAAERRRIAALDQASAATPSDSPQ